MERITDRQTSYIILSQCNQFHIFTSFSRISICFKVQESVRINMSISKIAQGKWSYLFNFCCEWKVQGSLGINMSRSKIAQGKWSYLFDEFHRKNARKTFAHFFTKSTFVCKCFPYVFNENQIGCSCFLFHVKRTENICTLLNQIDICVQMFSLRLKGKHFADFWWRSVQMFSLCSSFLSCF